MDTVLYPQSPDWAVQQEHVCYFPDSKVHRANMGPIWGRQDPSGHHVGPMNLAIGVVIETQQTVLLDHTSSIQYNPITSVGCAMHCQMAYTQEDLLLSNIVCKL